MKYCSYCDNDLTNSDSINSGKLHYCNQQCKEDAESPHKYGESCWSYHQVEGQYVCQTCGAEMDDDFDPSGPDENDPCWDYV